MLIFFKESSFKYLFRNILEVNYKINTAATFGALTNIDEFSRRRLVGDGLPLTVIQMSYVVEAKYNLRTVTEKKDNFCAFSLQCLIA